MSLCQSEGTRKIAVFANCCRLFVLKKADKKGGGGGSRAPQDPPGYAPGFSWVMGALFNNSLIQTLVNRLSSRH